MNELERYNATQLKRMAAAFDWMEARFKERRQKQLDRGLPSLARLTPDGTLEWGNVGASTWAEAVETAMLRRV